MKKLFAIVLSLALTASVFASKKMGAGLGYKVMADKEGLVMDLVGWWLNAIAYPSQPIAMIMGTWGADELDASKTYGCGLGYKVFAEKEPSLITQLVGWWLNAIAYPSQPIAMIMGTWGAEDADLAVSTASNLNIALAD